MSHARPNQHYDSEATRTRRLPVHLNEYEYRQIVEMAQRAGRTMSSFVRHAVLKDAVGRQGGNVSRRQAKEKGLTRYSTGKPCQNGHVSERWACNGVCVACFNAAFKASS